jgi:hypothetical protein
MEHLLLIHAIQNSTQRVGLLLASSIRPAAAKRRINALSSLIPGTIEIGESREGLFASFSNEGLTATDGEPQTDEQQKK